WVARMIMMSLHFMDEVPFHKVYVHGLVRDAEGQKMSKSKGNVLDPIDLIDGIDLETLVLKRTSGLMQPKLADKIRAATRRHFPDGIEAYGTDALRFTFYSLASTGRDIKFDLGRIDGYRNFCNKIWNAARYVLMNCEDQDCGADPSRPITLSLADRWIVSRLQQTSEEVERAIAQFRFDLASQALYEFIWNEYCDWYLELSKPVLWDEQASEDLKRGTRRTLIRVLETWLRLLHPLMPFITEEIWQRVAPLAGAEGPTIMLQPYPHCDRAAIDSAANADIEWLKKVIIGVRNIRGEMNIPPGRNLTLLCRHGSEVDATRLRENESFLKKLAKLESVGWLAKGETAPVAATALVGDLELLVPMAGLIDKDSELNRLGKEIDKLEKEQARLQAKLGNGAFVDRAPEEVVAKEREKLQAQQHALVKLRSQAEQMAGL
ncbi:MAG TPA: class I tRNA ligase family protein, partial [Kineobactrum sp.]